MDKKYQRNAVIAGWADAYADILYYCCSEFFGTLCTVLTTCPLYRSRRTHLMTTWKGCSMAYISDPVDQNMRRVLPTNNIICFVGSRSMEQLSILELTPSENCLYALAVAMSEYVYCSILN